MACNKKQLQRFLERVTSYHDVIIEDAGEGLSIYFYDDPSWDERELFNSSKNLFTQVYFYEDVEDGIKKNNKIPFSLMVCWW